MHYNVLVKRDCFRGEGFLTGLMFKLFLAGFKLFYGFEPFYAGHGSPCLSK